LNKFTKNRIDDEICSWIDIWARMRLSYGTFHIHYVVISG